MHCSCVYISENSPPNHLGCSHAVFNILLRSVGVHLINHTSRLYITYINTAVKEWTISCLTPHAIGTYVSSHTARCLATHTHTCFLPHWCNRICTGTFQTAAKSLSRVRSCLGNLAACKNQTKRTGFRKASCLMGVDSINPLQPRVNIQQFYVLPAECLSCFAWFSNKIATIPPHSIHRVIFTTQTECVYCAVQTASLEASQIVCLRSYLRFPVPTMVQI